ncbi:lysoplasmalogenase [Nocardioides marmoribigeumensis]|uniref:Membrane protein YhhN n=1 Tax=Nocardioides marmoribigeumensis TaxID=433649 RepID=A0ABU2BRX7_9ACTN|nr:lysoplasmalogenase [Nocardioides marmoribigeumensis]MDR7360478.1 putative membrane protein YhhN [Nocardioides marmoribigeumensis]
MTPSPPAPPHPSRPSAPARPLLRHPQALAAARAYTALALVDTRLAGHADPSVRRWRRLTKPLLMPALASAFSLATPQEASVLRRGTLVAQALSGAGDVALLGQGERAFLAGLGSFFGAHIAYVTAFASRARPRHDRSHLTGTKAAAATFATLGPALAWAAGRRAPALRAPVVAYAGILSSMVATSSRLGDDVAPSARRTVVVGTATFLASDATIALRRFVLSSPTPRSDAVVMATYTAGQGLIAAGVAAALRGHGPGGPS